MRVLLIANIGKNSNKLNFQKEVYWSMYLLKDAEIPPISPEFSQFTTHSRLLTFNSLSRLPWFPLPVGKLFPHVGNDVSWQCQLYKLLVVVVVYWGSWGLNPCLHACWTCALPLWPHSLVLQVLRSKEKRHLSLQLQQESPREDSSLSISGLGWEADTIVSSTRTSNNGVTKHTKLRKY